MSGEHEGRIALVTGAAGDGMGQATARRLAREGATLALNDMHERRLGEVETAMREEFGERVRGFPFDVADRASVDRGLEAIQKELGPIDILINNAAFNVLGPLSEIDPSDWDKIVAVDYTGIFYLIRKTLPGMMERGWGRIVNVSSVASYGHGNGRDGPYASAKAALNAMTRAVAFEGGPHGVRCNAVAPGLIWTRFTRKNADHFEGVAEEIPLRRVGEPEDVANVIAFLCSEQSAYITGETLNISGGMYMRA